MEDTKSPKKILKEKQIFYGYNNAPMKWADIKNLQLEDDDIIQAGLTMTILTIMDIGIIKLLEW